MQNIGEVMVLKELKALANDKRLKILYVLTINNFCQIHIIELTQLSQVDVSRNLKPLVDMGLVDSEREGNRVFFSLSKKMKIEYKNQLEQIIKEYEYLSSGVDINKFIDKCKNFES